MKYDWLILQDGSLPLKPDGRRTDEEHVCTATLIWPAGREPSRFNSIVVDPCFSPAGWEKAARGLQERGFCLDEIGYYFETHQHYDHLLHFPGVGSGEQHRRDGGAGERDWTLLTAQQLSSFEELTLVHCPGHSPDLQALCCETADGETWILGDAILDRQWLSAWMFYWPNGYEAPEVIETWRSIAKILKTASLVIPGHGPPIHIDSELLAGLVENFPKAFQSGECPDVARCIQERLERL